MTHSPIDAPPDGHARHGSTDQSVEADKHVFVDSTGRRALLLRRAGIVLGAAFLVYGGMVGVSFMGGPSLAPAEIAPFDSVGSTQDQGTNERVDKDGSPSARSSAEPCSPPNMRKQCRQNKNCRKHPKQCRRNALRRAADGRTGASRPQAPRSGQPAQPEQSAQSEQSTRPEQSAPATVR